MPEERQEEGRVGETEPVNLSKATMTSDYKMVIFYCVPYILPLSILAFL